MASDLLAENLISSLLDCQPLVEANDVDTFPTPVLLLNHTQHESCAGENSFFFFKHG